MCSEREVGALYRILYAGGDESKASTGPRGRRRLTRDLRGMLAGLKRSVRETSEVEPRINVNIWVDISRPADPHIRRSCHPIFHPIYGRDSRGRSDTVSA